MSPNYRLKNILTGETYSLTQKASVIGRNYHCEIKIDSVALSRNHASLHQTSDGVVLEDLNSTNGTFVNNVRIDKPALLTDGDVITIGNHRLLFMESARLKPDLLLDQHLMEAIEMMNVGDRTANKTMIHSTFAQSMGGLPIAALEPIEESVDQLVLRALRSRRFDPARVPAALIIKNTRNRGTLIQLKLPGGGSPVWAIGRSQLADVVFDDPTVSYMHAVISEQEGQWTIVDNTSTNGVKVNDVAVESSPCHHGDVISIGGIEVIFFILHA